MIVIIVWIMGFDFVLVVIGRVVVVVLCKY